MKTTAPKKASWLIILLSLLGVLVVVFFVFLRQKLLLSNSTNWEGVKVVGATESFCGELGCVYNPEELTHSVLALRILELNENTLSSNTMEILAESWNANNNEIRNVTIQLDKSLVDNPEDLVADRLPRNFSMKLLLEKYAFPKLVLGKERNYSIYRYGVSEIVFKDLQEQYLGKDTSFLQLKEEILDSLQQQEVSEGRVEEGQTSVISSLFLYRSSVTESRLNYMKDQIGYNCRSETTCGNVETPPLYYQTINIWEMAGIAQQKPREELLYNCAVLKKYFPEEKCTNPHPQLKQEVREILPTLNIPSEEDQGGPMATDSIIGNAEYVSQVRNDVQHWTDLNLMRNFDSYIANYIKILVEYMYYSDIDCEDEVGAEICQEIYPLYQYLKSRRGLGFCARRVYLPLLSRVSRDEDISNDLDYILENYPFEKECTVKGGAEGFCSVDLKERVACIELLAESLDYHSGGSRIEATLKQLTMETLNLYLEENAGKVGVWGRDEINIISGDSIEEELYPVKYYDYESNYVIYNVLDKYFGE